MESNRVMKKASLTIWGIIFFSHFLIAQDTSLQNLPKEWTLQDCIAYAKKNNIQLNSLRLSVASAEQDLSQAKYNRLPDVTGSVSQTLVNSKNADPVVGGFQTQASFSSSYGVSSSVVLFNGGYLKNDIRSKQYLLQSAGLTVEETANDITLSITQAFLNILLSKEKIKSLEEVLVTSQTQSKQGQQRFDAGSISKKDFLQFQSQVAMDNYNLVSENNNYRLFLATLKQILQLPSSYDFIVSEPGSVETQEAVLSLSEAQSTAIGIRPEVKNKDVAIKIAETELDKVKAGRLPTVSLRGGLSSGYSNSRDIDYFPQLDNNFYQTIGVNISIPIFSRFLNRTNIAKSKIVIEQAKLDLANTKTVLNQQVEQAYINLQNSQAQYAAADTQLRAARESYDITNEQLKLGAVNMVDVQQQRNTYIQALQSYIQAKYTAILYNKIYKFYTGEPVTF
jgi:outer membrane protein